MTSRNHKKPLPRAFAFLAVALLAICALGGVLYVSDDSDAATVYPAGGSKTLEVGTAYDLYIAQYSGYGSEYIWPDSMSYSGSIPGMTYYSSTTTTGGFNPDGKTGTYTYITSAGWQGTPTTTGTYTLNYSYKYIAGEDTSFSTYSGTCTVTVKSASTPVTSVSISGSSSVTKGSTLTLTATTSPTSATDRHVTWSITSGSSYATIQSTSDTTTGGKCVIKGVSAGSVTVKATAADGSGKSATKTITVNNPSYPYYLYFDANGGSGGPSDMSKTSTSTSSTLSFTIPSTEPTRSGYTFLGWSKSSSATSATYSPGDTVSVTYDDLTLYAVWQENKQYYYAYLYYNANNGSGAPSTQSDSIYAASASGSKTFTISNTKPSRSGYTFLGWSENSGATTASYQPGGTISVSYGGSKTLYAVWEQTKYTSTLNFSANGGSGAPSTMTDTHTSTSAHTFTIPSTKPTKTGFVFLGWSESSTASTASYQPGGTISVAYNGTKTLYAVWQTAQLDITSEPATKSLKVNQSWSYTPTTNISGCTVTVSGASWLSVSNGTVSGTPTTAGSYDVTITITKDGYTSDTQTFTLKVYSALGFNSLPGANGMFAFAE